VVNIKGKSAQTLAREKMVEDLRARGFFAWERKRKLPTHPSRIGIVTSPEGAVLHDLKRMISQRNPLVKITVFPTRVQGAEAAQEIADAIISANAEKELCDILIIARGGGSQAELAPYDNETVLTAAFQSRIPTISAIGHENDHPLLDLVTDVRAATPTHAAQLAVPALTEIAVAFQHTLQRLLTAWQYYDKQRTYQWHQLVRKFAQTGVTQSHLVSAQIWQRQKWRLFLAAQSLYEKEKSRQQEQTRKLMQLSPEEMFRNGYFWLEQNQHRLTALTECHLGEELTIIGEKVSIVAEVKEILKR
ncbi:MAG: exodeoxyribonuclease VII large subunit, partial [Negativicoccus succinicivorans]|nr:exodeoxyribonuclease VII large subunit [Negativicoccus succinicivorans]